MSVKIFWKRRRCVVKRKKFSLRRSVFTFAGKIQFPVSWIAWVAGWVYLLPLNIAFWIIILPVLLVFFREPLVVWRNRFVIRPRG